MLFLDEVTSGLDEQTDRDMMEVFRQVAEGGRLAFVGTPEQARSYLGIVRSATGTGMTLDRRAESAIRAPAWRQRLHPG